MIVYCCNGLMYMHSYAGYILYILYKNPPVVFFKLLACFVIFGHSVMSQLAVNIAPAEVGNQGMVSLRYLRCQLSHDSNPIIELIHQVCHRSSRLLANSLCNYRASKWERHTYIYIYRCFKMFPNFCAQLNSTQQPLLSTKKRNLGFPFTRHFDPKSCYRQPGLVPTPSAGAGAWGWTQPRCNFQWRTLRVEWLHKVNRCTYIQSTHTYCKYIHIYYHGIWSTWSWYTMIYQQDLSKVNGIIVNLHGFHCKTNALTKAKSSAWETMVFFQDQLGLVQRVEWFQHTWWTISIRYCLNQIGSMTYIIYSYELFQHTYE